ncbi:MAG: DNA-3-methyladenine glycosylase 2 family protein [Clostridia bacterium]|nr:DNA-3-methyladenine glycosylase 2 family protein [Clostridia bacterium]
MIINTKPFDLTQTFECGQCFRWNKNNDGSYIGVAHGKLIHIKENNGYIEMNDDSDIWREYFDLDTDYNSIIEALSVSDIMKNAIAKGSGIRILRQDFFETVISFIISQNNNIPRIKSIVENLCRHFGERIEGEYYSFPKAEALAPIEPEELAFLRAGYRDAYIIDAARKIVNNEIDMDIILHAPIDEARNEISRIKGVGPKVADCILLFGGARGEVFPTDVWMKRVLTNLYGFENLTPKAINSFAKESFGSLAGYAQQYLFYSVREETKL